MSITFNVFIAGICCAIATAIDPGFSADILASLISTNLFFCFGGFLPLPSVDCEVIWREVLRPISAWLKTNE